MSTTFHTPRNNVSTTVAAPHAIGDGSIVVATGTGARFGSSFPLIATAIRSSVVLAIFEVTARSGDTLTTSGAIEGTADVALMVDDILTMRPTVLAITELQGAIHALEGAGYLTSPIAEGDVTGLVSDLAGKQPVGAYLTALTGDATASGPGSSALALATVATPGTATKVTFDAKGRVTSGTTLVAGDIPAIPESGVTNLTTDLAAKAPLASPALTGTPTAPTPITADNSTTLATTANVKSNIAALGLGTASTHAATDFAQAITLNTSGVLHASPVTFTNTAGSFSGTLSLNTQSANTVLAGPTTGSAAVPTMRALAVADLPSTVVTGSGTANQLAYWSGTSAVAGSSNATFDGTDWVFLTGTTGTHPVVFRQTGGAAGTKEVKVFHNGTDGVIRSQGGDLKVDGNGTGIVALQYFGRDVFRVGNGAITHYAGPSGYEMYDSATTTTVGCEYFPTGPRFGSTGVIQWTSNAVFWQGSVDSGLSRASAGIVRVTNGSTGYGSIQSGVTDAGTTTTPVGLQVGHNTSGTAAATFGVTQLFVAQDSTTADQNVGRIVAQWATATHASRMGRLLGLADDSTGTSREGWRVESDGTQALVGFYGSNAQAKQTVTGSRGSNAALASLLTALANLGLITDSSS